MPLKRLLTEKPRKTTSSYERAEADMGGLQVDTWFPAQIWSIELDDAESLNKDLMLAIRGWQREDPEGIISRHSLSGWHSQNKLHLPGRKSRY